MRHPVVGKPRLQPLYQSLAISQHRSLRRIWLSNTARDHHFKRSIEKDDAGMVQSGERIARGP